MRAFWALFFLVMACHREKKEDLNLNVAKDVEIHSEKHTKPEGEETVTTEPTKKIELVTTTIEPLPAGPGVKRAQPGRVIQRRIETESGKIISVLKWEEPGDEFYNMTDKTKTQVKDKTDTTTDAGPGWKLYLTLALVAALVIGAALVILKFKLWRPL